MRCWPLGLLSVVLVAAGCAEPPEKELQQAQGTIAAAEAAGAPTYAPAELGAARAALAQAHRAAAQRDYRLALGYALDARQAAQDALRRAADEHGKARSEAEHALADLTVAINETAARLDAVRGTRGSRRLVARTEAAVAAARTALQEAGTARAAGHDREARDRLAAALEAIAAARRELDTVPPPRRRR